MSPSILASTLPGQVIFKTIKYFVDSRFREKVMPVPGSVVYCDLWAAVEHSGIHVADGAITNIEVDGLIESVVARTTARSFTSKSLLGRRIYVSCDRDGAVGGAAVAAEAESRLGERAFYGLVYGNCHQFCTTCIDQAYEHADSSIGEWLPSPADETWELSLRLLKARARTRLGATKWRLWDWDDQGAGTAPPEPDWQAHIEQYRHQPLDAAGIASLRAELAQALDYEAEIADEAIPASVRNHLVTLRGTLERIVERHAQARPFLALCPEAKWSYADLEACRDDLTELVKAIEGNRQIHELVRRLGRNYVSEEKKKRVRIPQASKSEVHGTHRSDDVMRLLPSELSNLEDETLEALFYVRLLEKNLLSYELRGATFSNGEAVDSQAKRGGPVVACLDTSGSMHGAPLLRAKALLLAIANVLRREDRALHVLLFSGTGQLSEFTMASGTDAAGLLAFVQQSFGGGTDFETPLRRAIDLIASHGDYRKADVLMISDGDCTLAPAFVDHVNQRKKELDCMVYSVLCAGSRVEDVFSDDVVVL